MAIAPERILTMILCGGKGERLYPLTRDRAKPSVPFLGSYRIIDFSLSNSLNSGLHKIALLTQYKSLSLERHILNGWNIFHPETKGYVISLPAQGRVADHWYEGTADAVFQNIYSIQRENPEAVLVLSGDHIYKADYRPIIVFYGESQADAVVLAKLKPRAEASRFGVIDVDEENRIKRFIEKPKNPPGMPRDPETTLISMGVYLFRTHVLIKALIRDAKDPSSNHDFGKDILPRLIEDSRVFAYPFENYWEDIGTIDAYYKANMLFLSPAPPLVVNDAAWPIRTYKPQFPPTFIGKGTIRNSIVSSGCLIKDAHLHDAILSPGVKVGEGARVEGAILFEGAEVGPKARVQNAVVDKFCRIPAGFVLGADEKEDSRYFKLSAGRVRVVPKGWKLE
ncbi:MAG: glucose-1-phosphate adenylyltransferase [Candidatus Aminicenantes bacterium]|nr:glucose-1-phosphate adenylyltransferase [Candidatus Aminicenantes bacterium]